MLEMDRLERQLVNLPLLQDPSSYIPDTVDLTEDALAREYWLYCFEEALDGVGLANKQSYFFSLFNAGVCRGQAFISGCIGWMSSLLFSAIRWS